jgi:ATP-binding cassette, subfamily B, bacterial PglK
MIFNIRRMPHSMRLVTIRQTLHLLTKENQRKYFLFTGIQTLLSFLDLIGVVIVGLLGSLTISGVQSRNPDTHSYKFLKILGIADVQFQTQAVVLGVLAAVLLIAKSILSAFYSKITIRFLSAMSAEITSNYFEEFLYQPYQKIRVRSTHEVLYGLTWGISTLMIGVLGTISSLIADLFLFLILSISLFFVNFIVGSLSTVIFGAVGATMYFALKARAKRLGQLETELSIESNAVITEAIESYREAFVGNYRDYYALRVRSIRFNLAKVAAQSSYIPILNKYVIEATLVVSALIISATQFILYDAVKAVAGIAIVLASGSRIAPAILRVQHGALVLKSSFGAAEQTFEIIQSLETIASKSNRILRFNDAARPFHSDLLINNLSFKFDNSDDFLIRNLSLSLKKGEHVAVVGDSGTGKSTLADLVLGILTPTSGSVSISGIEPHEAIQIWPGKISYVPQQTKLINGSIRENLIRGKDINEFSDDNLWAALRGANLDIEIQALEKGLDCLVGTGGINLSGGQTQRLGIARALVTNPEFLVLDEPTSALDGNSEHEIALTVASLKETVTVIFIAHRLSSIRFFEKIALLESGRIQIVGSIQAVKEFSPNFARLADAAGL